MSAEKIIFLGTGRRKTSTARVRLSEGTGKLTANGSEFEVYFSHENFAKQAYLPLLTVELKDKIDVDVNVAGGGVTDAMLATAATRSARETTVSIEAQSAATVTSPSASIELSRTSTAVAQVAASAATRGYRRRVSSLA